MGRDDLEKLADSLKEVLPFAYLFSSPKLHLDTGLDFAIGLVIQPGPHGLIAQVKQLISNPVQLANWWGHTAIYVRSKGSIVRAIGFDPHRLKMFNITNGIAGLVSSGKGPTKGVIYDEDMMFTSPDMICIEFKVPKKYIERVLKKLQDPGHSNKYLTNYVTRGGEKLKNITFDPQHMGNCINYVNMVLKKAGLQAIQGSIKPLILNPAQGKLTLSVIKRDVRLRIVDQNRTIEGNVIYMPTFLQISRRGAGVMKSISLVKVVTRIVSGLAQVVGLTRATTTFTADVILCSALILDFLMETVPADSWFWKLPVRVIEGLLETGGTLCMMYTIYSGDPTAWYQGLMSFLLLVTCLFI